MKSAAVLASLAIAEGATSLKLAFSDCGAAHGKITGLTPDTLPLGQTTTATGSGTVDEAVSGGSFEMDLKASIISQKFTGDFCSSKSFSLPLGTGTIKWDGLNCPVAAGAVSVPVDITLSSSLPAALQSVDLTVKGTGSNGDDLFCMDIKTSPAETQARKYSKGYKRGPWPNDIEMTVAPLTEEDIAAAPDSIDWSNKGATTSVNDQGQCGSCWAFSTTEGVESGVFMSTGKLPAHLSVQELVACEKQDDGCDGGDIPEAVSYLKKNGMATNANYPDTSSQRGKSGKCKSFKSSVQVTGMQYAIPPCTSGNCAGQNEEALAAALAKYGPISVCINSGDGQSGDWQPYSGGILTGSCKAKASLIDHCVQLVGYDKTAPKPYWKVRNSWGESWGESGFIRLPYGNKNECCIGCEAVIISATMSEDIVV